MDGFDPLFDDEPLVQPSFSLALPTFDNPPPVLTVRGSVDTDSDFLFFEQNVGTIALDGSHRSERSSIFSPIAPLASSSTDNSSQIKTSRRSIGPSKKRKNASVAPQPYQPSSVQESVLVQLAKDPNVIPLLQSIVEYVYRTNLAPAQLPPAPSSQSPCNGTPRDGPPAKKRRVLRKVPAGAEDWAVPFPFKEGEGPQHYQETWEMRRLIILLGSLMRNLRDWRHKHGTVSVNPQARERVYRSRKRASESGTPQPAEPDTPTSANSLPDLNSGLEVPNPSSLDGTLQSLVDLFSSYEQTNQSFLNVDLGALGAGTDLSQILFTTDGIEQSDMWWDTSSPFSNELGGMMSQVETPSTASYTPHQLQDPDTAMIYTDQTPLFGGVDPSSLMYDASVIGPHPTSQEKAQDAMDLFGNISLTDQHLSPSTPSLHIEASSHNDMAGVISESQYSTSVPSMTVSPSVSVSTELPPIEVMEQDPTPPVATTRGIATLSKRGRARSSAVLRRDLNKQLRSGNAAEGSSGTSADPARSAPAPAPATGRKPRASPATIKSREELLERAKGWREMLEKDLEAARLARWETMMEGLVLHEIGLKVRKTELG